MMWLFRLVTTIISQFVKDEKQGNAEQNALAMGHFFIPELYHFQFTSMDLTYRSTWVYKETYHPTNVVVVVSHFAIEYYWDFRDLVRN